MEYPRVTSFGRLWNVLGAAVALGAMAFPTFAGAPGDQAAYKTVKVVSLGAPDRWDYIHYDAVSGRVYVAHGDQVSVVDAKTGKVIGAVSGIPGGTHGIAFFHKNGQGFTDDGHAGEAVVFDLKSLKVIKHIKAEPDADGIFYDGPSMHIFVIDGDSGALTVIDPMTDTAVATVKVGAGLEFGVSGDNGKAYVDGADKHDIVRIDTKTNMVDAHWPMPSCEHPHGLAIDREHHRLFSSCGNGTMVVMNSDNGAIVANLPIGQGTDSAHFDPKRQLAFSSNFTGTLSVIHEDGPNKYTVLPSIKTPVSGRTMGIDTETGRVFIAAGDVTVNPNAAPSDRHHRYKMAPGSLKLYMLDPAH